MPKNQYDGTILAKFQMCRVLQNHTTVQKRTLDDLKKTYHYLMIFEVTLILIYINKIYNGYGLKSHYMIVSEQR